jgi:hypothetical protein
VRGRHFGIDQALHHLGRQAGALADEMQPHAVAAEPGHLAAERADHEFHQARHFLDRTVPVLGREREHREHAHAAVGTGLDATPQRLHTLLVPRHARQEPPRRPTAVAVHDDGNVVGNARR